jgi:FemAB-related protein (PEP-CTERM system-associated)
MPKRIEFLSPGKEEDWDEYVLRSGSGTFFHQTGWKRIVENTFGFEPKYLFASDGGTIKGVLPLFQVPLLPYGKCLISTPFAVYGGICSDDGGTANALLGAAVDFLSGMKGNYIELRHVKSPLLALPKKDLYVTFRRPIFSTEDANMAAIPRKERAEIRKGMKNNLISRWGGEEFLDSFYDIYSCSVRNLGTPVFPKALFRNLLNEFKDKCRILTVRNGDDMIAGVMTFFFKDQVMPYYGGSLKECFSLSVNDFMYWDLLRHGLNSGYKVFDFGRSKKGTGSYKFKEHWGFVPEPLEYQYYLPDGASMPNVSPSNPKFAFAINVWRRLPLKIANLIGPPITRYLP